MILHLPYPPSKLNPNRQSRAHWVPHARAVKTYRNLWAFEALAQGLRGTGGEVVQAKVTIHPPDRRVRDVQNCISALKAGVDGLADVSGVDDSRWQIDWPETFAEPVKGGSVIVEIQHV